MVSVDLLLFRDKGARGMRALSNDIITKSAQQNQTIAAEAEPCVSLRISRNNMELTNMDLVEKIRVRRTNADTLTDADLAVQHPTFRGENTKIWVAYIHSGSLGLRWAYDTENLTETSWNVVSLGAPSAVACAVAFNSDVVESDHGYFEYVTSEDYPLVFYVDSNGALHCISNGDPLSNVVLESSGVTDVTVIRGSASKAENWDYGLTAFYLKSGNLYYRQFLDGVWNTAGQVNHGISGETLSKIDAFATQDRKVGVQILTNSGKLYQIVTSDEVPDPTTWVSVTWTGPASARTPWTDGNDYYTSQSMGSGSYKTWMLDKNSLRNWLEAPSVNEYHFRRELTSYTLFRDKNGVVNYLYNGAGFFFDESVQLWKRKATKTNIVYGEYHWTDGNNDYYSKGDKHFVYSNGWVSKTWSGVTYFDGLDVWSDSTHTYLSKTLTETYELNRSTSTWNAVSFTIEGGGSYGAGRYIWKCQGTIYCSKPPIGATPSRQYYLDTSTNTWKAKTWFGLTDFSAEQIWTDGVNTYYSNGNNSWILDYATATWSPVTFTVPDGEYNYILAGNIWNDNAGNTYMTLYASSNPDKVCILDRATRTWIRCPQYGLMPNLLPWTDVETGYIFTSLENAFGSNSTWNYVNYMFDKDTHTWSEIKLTSSYTIYSNSRYMWDDGIHTYYSHGNSQYQFNYSISQKWQSVTWRGISNPEGYNVWKDEEGHIYYSVGPSGQYILDVTNRQWSQKTWTVEGAGVSYIYGEYIWHAYGNVYCSYSNKNFKLNSETDTWESVTFEGLTQPTAGSVWEYEGTVYHALGWQLLHGSSGGERTYYWLNAQQLNGTADETGATFTYSNQGVEAVYPNSGLKYKTANLADGDWGELVLSSEDEIEATDYEYIKSDQPMAGSLYIIGLYRDNSKDTLYLFRYNCERDVSHLVENLTLTLQSDNPITQVSASIKNIKDALFITESSLFAPSTRLDVGITYGNSELVLLARCYTDEVDWKHGAKTVSLSGRNAVGYFLNSQTFDEDKSYKGTAVEILTEIFDLFGIASYEIDDSDSKSIEFEVSANDTGLKAVQIVSDLMSDILNDKIWDVEEMYDGTVIAGFAVFRGEYIPKGEYVFHGKNDVFTRKITRSIDGAFSHVRCTGTDKSNHDLTPAYEPIETWEYWKPATHRTYHAPKVDGLANDAELAKYCKILAKQLRKSGQTVNYSTTLKPQLLVGDVAYIQGEEGEDNEQLGIITEIKHSFGVKGYMTDFTAASGGVIDTIGNNTYTKKKSVGGTDRNRRLSDFMGNTEIPTQESNNPVEPQAYITKFNYAHFDGQGYIELPITVADITANIRLEIMFELDRFVANMAVFGNETSDSYVHLATGSTDGTWSTSSGASQHDFNAPSTGVMSFRLNDEGDNIMIYNGQEHLEGYYTPSGYQWRLWLGGNRDSSYRFIGKISGVRLADLSNNTILLDLEPARYYSADGNVLNEGLYDTVSKQWYSCAGMTVDKPYIQTYNYAHFDGRDYIVLPYIISGNYKTTVWFKIDEFKAHMAVFGNEKGADYLHLATGAQTDEWNTSDGSQEQTFTATLQSGDMAFVGNHQGKNWMFYEGSNHEVSSYSTLAQPYKMWIAGNGGMSGDLNFVGDIKRFTIHSISEDVDVADIVPAERYSADGELLNRGLYDVINKQWYTCNGLTVHN